MRETQYLNLKPTKHCPCMAAGSVRSQRFEGESFERGCARKPFLHIHMLCDRSQGPESQKMEQA